MVGLCGRKASVCVADASDERKQNERRKESVTSVSKEKNMAEENGEWRTMSTVYATKSGVCKGVARGVTPCLDGEREDGTKTE